MHQSHVVADQLLEFGSFLRCLFLIKVIHTLTNSKIFENKIFEVIVQQRTLRTRGFQSEVLYLSVEQAEKLCVDTVSEV